MNEHQFDLSFTPFVNNKAEFSQVAEYHTFDIHYHKFTLQDFAPYFPALPGFLEKVEKGETVSLIGVKNFLNNEMIKVIHQMQQYEFVEALAPAFYESRTMEFLIIMLKYISDVKTSVTVLYPIKTEDIQRSINRALQATDLPIGFRPGIYSI